MDAEELKSRQAPLKAQYRDAPEAALITDAGAEEIATVLKLTERYCVVFQSLTGNTALAVAHSVARR